MNATGIFLALIHWNISGIIIEGWAPDGPAGDCKSVSLFGSMAESDALRTHTNCNRLACHYHRILKDLLNNNLFSRLVNNHRSYVVYLLLFHSKGQTFV